MDISDRKRAEEALREADRQKDEFLQVIGNLLNNAAKYTPVELSDLRYWLEVAPDA